MLRSYFLTAINSLLKNKLFSFINITGLSVGLGACLLIALFVQHEMSYETQWRDADRLYRVNFSADMQDGGVTHFTEVPLLAMPAMAEYFDEKIEAWTRILWRSGIVGYGDLEFDRVLYYADADFPILFQYSVIAGDMATTFASPSNIALRKDMAEQLFGDENPIGHSLTMQYEDGTEEYRVTAVYQVSGNTIMDFPMLRLLDETALSDELLSWVSLNSDSYFKLSPGVDIDTLRSQIADFTDQHVDVSAFFPDPNLVTSEVALYSFQAMKDVYLNSPWDTFRDVGDKGQVIAFAAVAALILLIGCINFTILSVARAALRAKEVAMRKVIGAGRKQLIIQFLGESFIVVFLAMLLSLVMIELMLPAFRAFSGSAIDIDYASPFLYRALLCLLLLTSLLGGLYPAFVLSNCYPSRSLPAASVRKAGASIILRNTLVVFQFGISIALIIATSIIYLQAEYSRNRDPGYNKDNLLIISGIDERRYLYAQMETYKRRIEQLPEVVSVGFSTWRPSQKNKGVGSYDLLGEGAANYTIARTGIGYDFLETYQIPIVAGRDFNEEIDRLDPIFNLDPDIEEAEFSSPRSVLINESAARQLGFSNPEQALGRMIRTLNPEDGVREYTIIGVTADSHFYSLNALPRAEVFHLTPNRPNHLTVRYTGAAENVIGELEDAWHAQMGDDYFTYAFAAQYLEEEFSQEKAEAGMMLSFSVLSIVIACLGLYGLAAFTVDRRTKEIGIRKVMGAEVRQIVALLMWQFSKPVLLANIVAWPVTLWVMLRWLQQFPYQINTIFLIPLCVLAGFIALSIAWLTVGGTAMKVASRKMVLALRFE